MLKVMIVEDDLDTGEAVKFFLMSIGHTVHLVPNGIEALKALNDFMPDMVLTDYQMPEMDGLMLTKVLKLQRPSLPVIFMTCSKDPNTAAASIKAGADDFVSKPFDLEKLEKIIQTTGYKKQDSLAKLNLKDTEHEKIIKAIRETKTLEEAARLLGICTETLWRKRKKLGLIDKKSA